MRITRAYQGENALLRASIPTPSSSPVTPRNTHEIHLDAETDSTLADEEYRSLIARAANDAVRDWDVATGRLRWRGGLEDLLGYPASTLCDEIAFWQRHLHPEDRVRTAASIRDALAHADHWNGEYRFRRADGTYLHLLERAAILRGTDGKARRFVGSLMDITARKQLHDQLCRSQKMEAFGQLASGVAHDFNNFLTSILGYSDLLLDEPDVKGHIARHIGEIRSAAGRASALTAQLLAFSRKHPLDPRVLEVNAFIANLERSLLRLLGENISVECDLHRSRSGVHIEVDPGQFTQIIVNLVVNARDAMPDGGRLTLATGNLRIHDDAPSDHGTDQLPPGEYVCISVTDNGTGMSDEVQARLFEPFFTTKHGTRGSGLGLATSYGIVRQSGGDIRVQSKRGSGTTITIYIPKVAAPRLPDYQRPQSRKLPTGTETVLVLEDDVSVRHISVRILRGLGYDVIEAANGDDAQRLISGSWDRKIHLLLTDIVMPHMSGRDFAQWLRQASPETRVVFISGYLDEAGNPDAPGADDLFFLPKPFDPGQ